MARTIVLRMLTGAPRSRHQLAEALAKRGVPDDVADRVLDRMTEVGLVDDRKYAEMLVRTRHEERGLSRRALAVELRRKGVGEDEAAAALDGIDTEAEEVAARALLQRRWRTMSGLAPEVRARRAAAMLGRKGYPGGLAMRLVRELMDSERDGSWDSWTPD